LGLFSTIYIDQEIADKVVEIRKHHRIKLPDAIIAATAMAGNLVLISRNTDDFKNLDLKVLNPFSENSSC